MPDSGAWASEQVFSVPLAPGAESRSPGLVVFECSPLHGLEDEIEKCVDSVFYRTCYLITYTIPSRKYRIVDDCARLREIVAMFPQDRHFIPSVLFILWGEDEAETLADDVRHMVSSPPTFDSFDRAHMKQVDDYATKGVLGSHATFSISSKTKDLDEKFTQIIGSMDLDRTGGLVEILSRQGKRTNGIGDEPLCSYSFYQSFCR